MTRFFHIIDLIGYIYTGSQRDLLTQALPSDALIYLYSLELFFFHNIIETMKSQKKTDDGEFSKALLSTLLEEVILDQGVVKKSKKTPFFSQFFLPYKWINLFVSQPIFFK